MEIIPQEVCDEYKKMIDKLEDDRLKQEAEINQNQIAPVGYKNPHWEGKIKDLPTPVMKKYLFPSALSRSNTANLDKDDGDPSPLRRKKTIKSVSFADLSDNEGGSARKVSTPIRSSNFGKKQKKRGSPVPLAVQL